MNLDPAAFDPGLGRRLAIASKRANVSSGSPDSRCNRAGWREKISRFDPLRQGQQKEENRIPRRDVGNGMPRAISSTRLWEPDLVGERRAADGAEIELDHPVGFSV
jgi:hypothetical protein